MSVDDYFVFFVFIVAQLPLGNFSVAGLDDGALFVGELDIGFVIVSPNPCWTLRLGPVYVVPIGLPLVATPNLHFLRSTPAVVAAIRIALNLPLPEHRLGLVYGLNEFAALVARARRRRNLIGEGFRRLVEALPSLLTRLCHLLIVDQDLQFLRNVLKGVDFRPHFIPHAAIPRSLVLRKIPFPQRQNRRGERPVVEKLMRFIGTSCCR